jgi:hypothetical protein
MLILCGRNRNSEEYSGQFRENLERVSGRIELGIKVFYRLDPDGPEPAERPASSPRDYIMGRYEKYLSQKKQAERLFTDMDAIHRKLSDIADDCRYTKPMKNNLIFNASYLVKKSRKNEFDRAVGEAAADYSAYKIHYSGPWPAYHFVRVVREEDEDG